MLPDMLILLYVSGFRFIGLYSYNRLGICFFFRSTATTGIYTLSLHDALPIWRPCRCREGAAWTGSARTGSARQGAQAGDRKSTRLNSSHANISYAVFCLKKKIDANLHAKGFLGIIEEFDSPHDWVSGQMEKC